MHVQVSCYATSTSTHKFLELLHMFCKAGLVFGMTERGLCQLYQLIHTRCSSRIRHGVENRKKVTVLN